MKAHHVTALKHIALLGGMKGTVSLSSGDLATVLGVSQQTASQRILYLVKEGFISRTTISRRAQFKLTPKGVDILRREFADYKRMFEVGKELQLKGVVESGLGEGAFYMRQKGYKEQFRKKLGYEPYEGTLNLRCPLGELATLEILRRTEGIQIEEFESGGRTFGGAKCFRARVKNVECAIIMPLRSHHTETFEVISRQNLRTRHGLTDGDNVELTVQI